MACDFQITYHQEDAEAAEPVMQALDTIEQLEAQLTIYRAEQRVLELNRSAAAGPVQVEPHLFALLEQCQRLSEVMTAGAFDITSTPLSADMGFSETRRANARVRAGRSGAWRKSITAKSCSTLNEQRSNSPKKGSKST